MRKRGGFFNCVFFIRKNNRRLRRVCTRSIMMARTIAVKQRYLKIARNRLVQSRQPNCLSGDARAVIPAARIAGVALTELGTSRTELQARQEVGLRNERKHHSCDGPGSARSWIALLRAGRHTLLELSCLTQALRLEDRKPSDYGLKPHQLKVLAGRASRSSVRKGWYYSEELEYLNHLFLTKQCTPNVLGLSARRWRMLCRKRGIC